MPVHLHLKRSRAICYVHYFPTFRVIYFTLVAVFRAESFTKQDTPTKSTFLFTRAAQGEKGPVHTHLGDAWDELLWNRWSVFLKECFKEVSQFSLLPFHCFFLRTSTQLCSAVQRRRHFIRGMSWRQCLLVAMGVGLTILGVCLQLLMKEPCIYFGLIWIVPFVMLALCTEGWVIVVILCGHHNP